MSRRVQVLFPAFIFLGVAMVSATARPAISVEVRLLTGALTFADRTTIEA
jgi:hypothetical protein